MTLLLTSEDNEDENNIDVPTYPKYSMGGCIAKAGSCNIGFNPNPSLGIGNKRLNGLEVIIKNKKKPVIIIC